jgi:hypothetical protein
MVMEKNLVMTDQLFEAFGFRKLGNIWDYANRDVRYHYEWQYNVSKKYPLFKDVLLGYMKYWERDMKNSALSEIRQSLGFRQ